jgi:hypothetical protein
VWAKIEYVERFSPISAEDVFEFMKQERDFHARKITARKRTALDVYYSRMSIIKSTVWECGAEWRLMWRSIENRGAVYKCPIGANAIRAVQLGLRIRGEISESGRRGLGIGESPALALRCD